MGESVIEDLMLKVLANELWENFRELHTRISPPEIGIETGNGLAKFRMSAMDVRGGKLEGSLTIRSGAFEFMKNDYQYRADVMRCWATALHLFGPCDITLRV